MPKLQLALPIHHRGIVPCVSAALLMSKYIFLKMNGYKTSLQCPYEGPFQISDHSDKFFTLQMSEKIDTISIDHIRTAFLEMVYWDTDSGKPSLSSSLSTPSTNSNHLDTVTN